MIVQLLRERPPGYGGVERVAHHLASVWRGPVFSLALPRRLAKGSDPLTVSYRRISLRRVRWGRLFLPFPTRSLKELLLSSSPLHGHLPSPEVLMLLLIAKALRPKRKISIHWHSFLDEEAGFSGFSNAIYQRIAYSIVPLFADLIITTSPLLQEDLKAIFPKLLVEILPCSLDLESEKCLLVIGERKPFEQCLNIVFIGRLDSYKRLDWLMEALMEISVPWHLSVVGDGPKRTSFESFANRYFAETGQIKFWGIVSELEKQRILSHSHILALPSDKCNEAFGIAQLEAMASGIPALALNYPRTGMSWVCNLPSLVWSQKRAELPKIINSLTNPCIHKAACSEARKRYILLFSWQVWHDKLKCITDQIIYSSDNSYID